MAPLDSPLPSMAPTATPTGMSSRLMTMKFMQRGAASAAGSPATTPKTDSEGSAKRRKTSHKESADIKPLYDEKAVQAALEEEENKREAAIAKRAEELGDEHWVLTGAQLPSSTSQNHVNLNYVQVGFAQIDSGFASNDDITGVTGRRQFNMKKQRGKQAVKPGPESDLESDSSDLDDKSDSDSAASTENHAHGRGRQSESTPSGHRKRTRSAASKRREAERAKAHELAEKRRKKEVKLNTLTSLSSGGASPATFGSRQSRGPGGSMKCYACGKTGHMKQDCPSGRKYH